MVSHLRWSVEISQFGHGFKYVFYVVPLWKEMITAITVCVVVVDDGAFYDIFFYFCCFC